MQSDRYHEGSDSSVPTRPRVSRSEVAERLVRILLVDDERLVLRAMKRLIVSRHPEWEVLFANSADEALRLLARHAPVDVLVSDLNMPEVDGVILLNIVRQRYPETARVVHSAHIEAFGPDLINDLCISALPKPAGVSELVEALELASGCGSGSEGALVAG